MVNKKKKDRQTSSSGASPKVGYNKQTYSPKHPTQQKETADERYDAFDLKYEETTSQKRKKKKEEK